MYVKRITDSIFNWYSILIVIENEDCLNYFTTPTKIILRKNIEDFQTLDMPALEIKMTLINRNNMLYKNEKEHFFMKIADKFLEI